MDIAFVLHERENKLHSYGFYCLSVFALVIQTFDFCFIHLRRNATTVTAFRLTKNDCISFFSNGECDERIIIIVSYIFCMIAQALQLTLHLRKTGSVKGFGCGVCWVLDWG